MAVQAAAAAAARQAVTTVVAATEMVVAEVAGKAGAGTPAGLMEGSVVVVVVAKAVEAMGMEVVGMAVVVRAGSTLASRRRPHHHLDPWRPVSNRSRGRMNECVFDRP